MSSYKNNPIVILDDIALDLSEEDINKIAMGMGHVLETTAPTADAASTTISAVTTPASPAAAAAPASATLADVVANYSNDEEWFRAGPSKTPARSSRVTPRPSPGRKNMEMLKSIHMPSPSPSSTSTQSSAAGEDEEDSDSNFVEEEKRRRIEWVKLATAKKERVGRKWTRARDLVSSLTGEGKRLKNQRDALRAQIRALEQQMRALDGEEADLEKRKRSALKSEKKYEAIVAKYREMDL